MEFKKQQQLKFLVYEGKYENFVFCCTADKKLNNPANATRRLWVVFEN